MVESFFPYIGAFSWIGLLLMVGVVLRAKVKFLQKILFPANLIAGLLGFILMQFDLIGMPTAEGWKVIPTSTFVMITFHLFAFTFVGIGFLKNEEQISTRKLMKGATWIAIMLSVVYAAQALVGIGAFWGWNVITDSSTEIINGILVGTGFTQGPGQAQAFATIWQNSFNVKDSIDIGLTFSAVGFLVAGLVGIPMANYFIKTGQTVDKDNKDIPEEFKCGILYKDKQPLVVKETLHNASVSTLGFHLGSMLFIYYVAYMVALSIQVYAIQILAALAFGMLFMIALVVAKCFKKITTQFKFDYVYDNATIKSITNACTDLLICGVFMGINTTTVKSLIVPMSAAILFATIVTVFFCIYYGKKCSSHGVERFMCLFGYATGTGANALMLLRVVDPKANSPVLLEAGLVIIIQMLVALPFTIIIPIAPVLGILPLIGLLSAIVVVGIILVSLLNSKIFAFNR